MQLFISVSVNFSFCSVLISISITSCMSRKDKDVLQLDKFALQFHPPYKDFSY